MPEFVYRSGNGNDGDYVRQIVELTPQDDPYTALKALLVNEYEIGSTGQACVIEHAEVDGEAEFGLHAVCHEGPGGETEFGAAWRTAQLNPLETGHDIVPDGTNRLTLVETLDAGALAYYEANRQKSE